MINRITYFTYCKNCGNYYESGTTHICLRRESRTYGNGGGMNGKEIVEQYLRYIIDKCQEQIANPKCAMGKSHNIEIVEHLYETIKIIREEGEDV